MNHVRTSFNAVSPLVLFGFFLASAVTVFFACYMLTKPKSSSNESSKSQKEDNSEKKLKGKRQRRFNVKKEIRAMEMEEKRKQRQEKKEEAKVERAKSRKVDGKKEQQQKKQKTLRLAENFTGAGRGTVTTRSIPRKRS